MEILRKLPNKNAIISSVITIGSYDGIHRGHHDVIRSVVNYSNALGIKAVLITFDPHPRHVIDRADKTISLLMGMNMKLETFKNLGIDIVYIIPFTKRFSKKSPLEFLNDIILPFFKPKYIIIGVDHQFGKDRSGTIGLLEEYCTNKKIYLKTIQLVNDRGNKISSSKIRSLIKKGYIKRANFQLGYIYGFQGKVIQGKGRGKKLGFPTANINLVEKNQLIPKQGVYFIRARISGLITYGMCNLGHRPTFNEKKFVIELHLFKDNMVDFYGKVILVEFLERIRDEIKFVSLNKLISQLKSDKNKCIKLKDKYN